ncbi:PQQ-binding-like beta-propeller repeat protein, partial [bacterium]|nr:PQQ-binding-like beta-propeller repeat protein [bacterium]
MRTASLALLIWIFVFIGIQSGNTADWPMWRYDEGRTAASPQQLADTLYMRWMHEYPALKPVWDDPLNQDLMQYDTVYEPIVVGKTLLFGSNAFDRIVALDTETGREKWTFHAGGPIRLPAVANQKNVYFTSDDGCLYCVRLENGELAWKYNSVPKERLMLGNERLVSTWVARGGAVLKDDVVYFGSGIWPFMGVFLFALDAETGEEIWVNDSSSVPYKEQPHGGAWAFGGIAPQGTIAISGERLLVPCGRSVPASFDRKTGALDYYKLHENGKTGGAFVCATDKHFFNYYRDGVVNLYDTATGEGIFFRAFGQPVVTDQAFYC